MTPRQFCTSGACESVKLGVHGAMLFGAVGCAIYNVGAFYYRGETHSAVNFLIYSALAALEYQHVQHHYRSSVTSTPDGVKD